VRTIQGARVGPDRRSINVSSDGPHPDAFTIRQTSADSDYAVARRAEEATDFGRLRRSLQRNGPLMRVSMYEQT
jgi:hypothetical protein